MDGMGYCKQHWDNGRGFTAPQESCGSGVKVIASLSVVVAWRLGRGRCYEVLELRVFQAGFGHRNKRGEDGCFLEFLGYSYMLYSLVCDFLSHLFLCFVSCLCSFQCGSQNRISVFFKCFWVENRGKDCAWGFYGLRLMKGLAAAMARSNLLFKPYSHSSY